MQKKNTLVYIKKWEQEQVVKVRVRVEVLNKK